MTDVCMGYDVPLGGLRFFSGVWGQRIFCNVTRNFRSPPKLGKKFRGPPKFQNKIWWPPKISEKNFAAPHTSKSSTIHRSRLSVTLYSAREIRH